MTTTLAIVALLYGFIGLLVAVRLMVSMVKDMFYGSQPLDYAMSAGLSLLVGLCWLPIAAFLWYLFGWKFLLDWWK
jgi:hypothetical protein